MKANNLACNGGSTLPTKSYRVGLSQRFGVEGTASEDATRSSKDAPFMMARYAEYVCMNVYYKLVNANWQVVTAILLNYVS